MSTEPEAALAERGSPELRWLWGRFRASGRPASELSDEELARDRRRHIGALLGMPYLSGLLSGLGTFYFGRLLAAHYGVSADAGALDRVMPVVTGLLCVYAAWFAAAVLQRTLVHPWDAVAAADLAFMLSRGGYRAWHDGTARARATLERLKALGISGRWDDPSWKVRLKASGGEFKEVEVLAPLEEARRAVREVLGHKPADVFVPGRYLGNLKDKKGSVSRFVKANQAALTALREDRLSLPEARALLSALRDTELTPGSAGARFLDGVLVSMEGGGALPSGVVEAAVWARDPLEDLGSASDFFSSASLRTGSWTDAVQRRTKGALGPFGYLRNKSVSALDFRTKDGRGVRARLAAAIVEGRVVLYVDAVEGRFDVRPAAVRRAVEAYARACGFKTVLYHAFPLNAVPRRFVEHLASGPLSAVPIEYADASEREYLDAWGLPFEPFEYSFPRGTVYGYARAVDGAPEVLGAPAGVVAATLRGWRGRGLLWAMSAGALACAAWSAARTG